MSIEKDSKIEKLQGKAQEELNHFFEDPAKVEKARSKAEGLLDKHLDEKSSDEVVNSIENVLRGFAGEEGHHSR